MKRVWGLILNTGVSDELSLTEKKSIRIVNSICAVAIVLVLLSVIINLLIHSSLFIAALLVAWLFLCLTYYLNYKKIHALAKVNTILVLVALLLFMSLKGGYGSGLEYYFLSMMALPVFLFRDKKMIYSFQALFIVCLLTQKFYSAYAGIDTNSLPHRIFYVFNCIGSSLIIILAVVFFKNLTVKNENELHEKNRIIEGKNSQLEEMNKQLDFFTYSVSHDLKAPLRGIEGYRKLLLAEYADKFSGDALRFMEEIRTNTVLMNELIENLLTFSHSAKKELDIKKVDVQELVNGIIKSYKNEIEKYKTAIVIGTLPPLEADADLMRNVFDNLFSNAIKYSRKKENPKVEINSFTGTDGNAVYFVKDNGTGFDVKYANKLFVPFQRLHSRADFEGTGVGLSIVKTIIERHGGRIWVEAAEGQGATFYFSLSKKKE